MAAHEVPPDRRSIYEGRHYVLRTWLQFVEIGIVSITLIYLAAQTTAMKQDLQRQLIIQVEDSERFINQLLLEHPELILRLASDDQSDGAELGTIETVLQGRGDSTAGDYTKLDQVALDQVKLKGNEPHAVLGKMAVAAAGPEFHEHGVIDGATEKPSRDADKVMASMAILGHVFLQEFEKMYRICTQGLVEEIFWKEYEGMMKKTINKPFIKKIWETYRKKDVDSQMDGYHPEFKSYLEDLYGNVKPPMKRGCFAAPNQFVQMVY